MPVRNARIITNVYLTIQFDGSGFFAGGNGSGFCFEEYKAGRHTDYANHSNRDTWIVR